MSERILIAVLIGLIIGAVVVFVWRRGGAFRGNARRRSGIAHTGWALLFLTSGRMPPPPPESQVEAELNGEKDRLGSRTMGPD